MCMPCHVLSSTPNVILLLGTVESIFTDNPKNPIIRRPFLLCPASILHQTHACSNYNASTAKKACLLLFLTLWSLSLEPPPPRQLKYFKNKLKTFLFSKHNTVNQHCPFPLSVHTMCVCVCVCCIYIYRLWSQLCLTCAYVYSVC